MILPNQQDLPSSVSVPPSVEEGEVLDLLTSLVDKSLVVYEQDECGQGRYRLLETVRQYAQKRLAEGGEAMRFWERHRAFFLEMAVASARELIGPEQAVWLERLE